MARAGGVRLDVAFGTKQVSHMEEGRMDVRIGPPYNVSANCDTLSV